MKSFRRTFPAFLSLLLPLACAVAPRAATAATSSSLGSLASRTPGFSTQPGECLETMRAAIAAQLSEGAAPDSSTQALYEAHEAAVEAVLLSLKTEEAGDEDRSLKRKEGAASAPSLGNSRAAADARPAGDQR